jgi:nitrite reductase (NO-forming)
VTDTPAPAAGGVPTGRARWHRRTGILPLAYLAGIAAVGLAHPFLAQWRWLAIHLLLLGAVTNAILFWSAHFSAAILRTPAPATRRGDAIWLGVLNAGVLTVLTAGSLDRPGSASSGLARSSPPSPGTCDGWWRGYAPRCRPASPSPCTTPRRGRRTADRCPVGA